MDADARLREDISATDRATMCDTGIERAFLACIMRTPALIHEARIRVAPHDLQSKHHRYLYEIIIYMQDMYASRGQPLVFDAATIVSRARQQGKEDVLSEKVGGLEYLYNIQSSPGTDEKAFSRYIDRILQCSARVAAYEKGRTLQEMAVNADAMEKNTFIASVEREMDSISDLRQQGGIVRIGDIVQPLLDECVHNRNNPGRFGVNVSFLPQLMKVVNTLRRRQFIILFARPKVGKSTLLLNIGLDVASQGVPVLYLDTEMCVEEQASRAVSNMSAKISLSAAVREWDILDGSYLNDSAKAKAIAEISALMTKCPLYYTPARGMNVNEIAGRIREFRDRYVGEEEIGGKMRSKPCLIIYDWLKVPDKTELSGNIREYQELGFIATKLNDTIAELDVPLIAGAQANRMGNDKGVGLKSAAYAQNFLADSDRLLRFCTCLIWLRRLNQEEMEIAQTLPKELFFNQMLHIVDQRRGPTCMEGICLDYHGEILTYVEKPHTDLEKYNEAEEKHGDGGDKGVKHDAAAARAAESAPAPIQDEGDDDIFGGQPAT